MDGSTLTIEQLINLVELELSDVTQSKGDLLLSLLHVIINKLNIAKSQIKIEGPGTEKLQDLVKKVQPNLEVSSDQTGQIVKGKNWKLPANETNACDNLTSSMKVNKLEDKLKKSNDRLLRIEYEIYELRKLHFMEECKKNQQFVEQITDECNKCTCSGGVEKTSVNIPFCIDYSDPFNDIVLSLLSNNEFLVELMKRVSCPILDKVSNWENQLQCLGDLFQQFRNKVDEEYNKLPTPEMNAAAIKELEECIKKFDKNFICVLEEIQSILDTKLNKADILPLKEYIKKQFKCINSELTYMKRYDQCPDAVGTTKAVFDNMTCLSCAGTVCQRSNPKQVPIIPRATPGRMLKRSDDKKTPTKRACGGSFTVIAPEERVFRSRNLVEEFGGGILDTEINFVRGANGNMYRAEPDIPICTCKDPKIGVEKCCCPANNENNSNVQENQ